MNGRRRVVLALIMVLGLRVFAGAIPVIYCTDLFHPHVDPDDHFDLATVFALPELQVKAILLDQGEKQLKQPGAVPLQQLLHLTGRNVPSAIGLGQKLVSPSDDGRAQPAKFQGAIDLLVKVLRETSEPVTIITAGSVRDVCAAFNREPALFKQKVGRLYLNIGNADPKQSEYNVDLDPQAYVGLLRSGLPLYLCLCLPMQQQGSNACFSTWWRFRQSDVLPSVPKELQNYFIYALQKCDPQELNPIRALQSDLAPWHRLVWEMDRNMWCTASFLHAAGRNVRKINGSWTVLPAAQQQPQHDAAPFTFVPARVEPDETGKTTIATNVPNANVQLFVSGAGYVEAMLASLKDTLNSFPEELLTHTDVFVSGKDGYSTYRIPAIEVAPDGSLIAFAEARKYNAADPGFGKQDIDLVYKRSTNNGAGWSSMTVLEDPGELWSAANPATVVDHTNGRVWVFYLRSWPGRSTETSRPGTDDMQTFARWSSDNGVFWSEAIDLTAVARDLNDMAWRASVPGPGGAIETRTGRLLVPMWKMPFSTFAIYSDDHGQTWKRGQFVPGAQGGDECQIVELADGRVLMDIRQETGSHRWLSESTDGGITWGQPRPGIQVAPVACAIERFGVETGAGERSVLLWTGPNRAERKQLRLLTSYDQGLSFRDERILSDDFAAYSDLAILKDHAVGLLWERGKNRAYEFITFTRLSPRMWTAGDNSQPAR